MKKLLIAMMVLLALGAVPVFAQKVRIGVSIPTADHGWTGGINYWAQKAIKDWQAKDKNIDFYLVTADSPAKQVNDVEDLMVKGIDALVILAHDSAPLTPVVKKRTKKVFMSFRSTVDLPKKYRMSILLEITRYGKGFCRVAWESTWWKGRHRCARRDSLRHQ